MASSPISQSPPAVTEVPASAPVGRPRRRSVPAAAPAAPSPTAAAGNPSLRLDPGLGLVVIEFRDTAGVVTGTIPTAQQLQAYRRWQDQQVGPPAPAAAGPSSVPPRRGRTGG